MNAADQKTFDALLQEWSRPVRAKALAALHASNVGFLKESNHAELLFQFRDEIGRKSAEIDPSTDHDWHGIAIGWVLAKGLQPEAARHFAQIVRDAFGYWHD